MAAMKKAHFKPLVRLRQADLQRALDSRDVAALARAWQAGKFSTFSVDNDVHSLVEVDLSRAGATHFAFPLKT